MSILHGCLLTLTLLQAPPPAAETKPARPPAYDGAAMCVLKVTELARARDWYRDVLGFRVLADRPEMGWCELATPVNGLRIGLAGNNKELTPSGSVVAAFGVTDIAESERRLKAAGVETYALRIIDGVVKLLAFRDPDGNLLQLHESLRPKEDTGLEPVAFMAGAWRHEEGNAVEEEHWTAPLAGSMLGNGRMVKGGRTVFFEYLRIERDGDDIVYIASPGGRGQTPFRMVHSERNKVVFENPTHDFPTRILYWLDDDGRLHARVEGKETGGEKAQEFVWSRASAR